MDEPRYHLGSVVHAKGETLEDFDGPVQPFARMYQLLWFMENVPGLKFTLDTGNFAYSDEDAVQAYEVLKDYIVHVHCKDRNVDPALTGEQIQSGTSCGCGRIGLSADERDSGSSERKRL